MAATTRLVDTRFRVFWCTLATAAALAVPAALPAQESQEHRVQAEIHYVSQASLGQGLTKAQLSNGMTVLVRENHAAPVATVRCLVRNTGSAFEGRYLGAGISHMLEHLVALGTTTNRSEDEIQQLLDSMGGRTNASTSSDRTLYYIDCPASRVDLAVELIADSMQNSVIPEDEYAREMGVVQRELEMGRANRGRMLHQSMKSLIYTEHPIRHPTIGYLPVVQSVDRKDVIAFYRNRYVPQNMVFVVVGDVDTRHVLEQILKNTKEFSRTVERGVVLPLEPDQASPRATRLEMEGETTHFSIGWPTVALQDPDLYPLDVLSYLLTNGDSSRLGRRLRIEQPLAISVVSFSYTPGYVKGWFEITVECQPENLPTCRKIVAEEIARLEHELAGDEELAKVKRQKAAEHVFAQQTVQSQADSLAMSFLATGDPLFDDQYVKGIQEVTAEQIRDAVGRYFLPERQNTVVIDPPGRESPESEKKDEPVESSVVRRQLDNGLTVLLKRHAVTPIVSIQAFVPGGVLADTAETSGAAALTAEMLTRGTEKYSGAQIAEHFDSIGGRLSTGSQRNTSYLQCSVLKDDFQVALDYVHQVLFRPAFVPEEFEKVRQRQLGQIAARTADPGMEIMDFWTTLLPDSSPYSRKILGTPATIARLTVAGCREFHRSYYVPNGMVLAVFGDIDPDEAWDLIAELFGGEPTSQAYAFPQYPREHQATEASSAQLASQRENTAMVLISYATVSALDTETRDTLDVLNTVLTGGAGAGGRLFNELRGERLVYYVFGHEMTGLAPGYFLFLAQTLPQTRDEVVRRIQANLQRIDEEGIAHDEFGLAKQKLIAQHAMQNTTPSSQAFQAAVFELYGLGYDHDEDYEERIEHVTVSDVQELVRRYFQQPLVVTSSPNTASEDTPQK